MPQLHLRAMTFGFALLIGLSSGAFADNEAPYAGTVSAKTEYSYDTLVDRLGEAVGHYKMGVVAQASATLGAKRLGVTIPGNRVIMVFHPKFAIRMLGASVSAGIEAPLRYYITEDADGTATLTYRTPSSTFAPYDSAKLNEMAAELDVIFANIAQRAQSN